MVFGMSLATYTLLHVLISFAGILTGLGVAIGLLTGRSLDRTTAVFLVTTVLTSVTGFGFPFHKLLPAHIVGAISLVVLGIAILARYKFHLQGAWRRTYVATAILALYLNVFVLVVQAFQKVPALQAMAPTQTETPFKIAQLIVLISFLSSGIASAIRFPNQTALGKPTV